MNKFVYKIHSGYDGFQPNKLPERMAGKSLQLGWKRYIDTVEEGDEIWIYFHGQHRFDNGVYAKGIAEKVDYHGGEVTCRITEYSTTQPVTSRSDSLRVAQVVAQRYRQVFFLPDSMVRVPDCMLWTTAVTCQQHQCGSCRTWDLLPLINRRILTTPPRLAGHVSRFAPAYWVIPNRSFIHREGRVRDGINQTSDLFYRFKAGDAAVAFPLALGMHKALARAHRLDFDHVVPVPLSPDKKKNQELDRTLVLAKELAALLGGSTTLPEGLTLTGPVSKRKLRTQDGHTAASFEYEYRKRLRVSASLSRGQSVLLVDDVCTEGSTLAVCAEAIREQNPHANVVAATAGQMVIRRVVADSSDLLKA